MVQPTVRLAFLGDRVYLPSLEVVREAMRLSRGAFRDGRGDERDDDREEGCLRSRGCRIA
jgi:hypothetical protein